MNKDVYREFVKYIKERQRIYRRKLAGDDKPWTKDELLKTYHFCNIFRQCDQTTIWINDHWCVLNKDSKQLPFALTVARAFNKVSTLKVIKFPHRWNEQRIIKLIHRYKTKYRTIFTNAFQIYPGPKGFGTINFTCGLLTKIHQAKNSWVHDTLEETWLALKQFKGYGGFRANEVVTDLCYHTDWLINAPDRNVWVHVGPGGKNGLARLYGRSKPNVSWSQATAELGELRDRLKRSLKNADPIFAQLELRNVEDCLCEFDKYVRTKAGGTYNRLYSYEGHRFSISGLLQKLVLEGNLTDRAMLDVVMETFRLPADWWVTRSHYAAWYRRFLRYRGLDPPAARR